MWVCVPLGLLFASILSADGQNTQVQVAEFGIETKRDNYFEILPNQENVNSLDFSICLRCRFWTWNDKIVFSSNVMELFLTNQNNVFELLSQTIEFPLDSLKVSPTLWNSFCFVHNSTNSSVTVDINGFKDISHIYTTTLKKDDLKKKITIGDASTHDWGEYHRFSGQITDFNFWNKALNPTEVLDFVTGCSEKLFEK